MGLVMDLQVASLKGCSGVWTEIMPINFLILLLENEIY